MSFCIGKDRLTNGAKILETNDRGALLELDKEGAGILIPEFLSRKERYFIFKVKVLEEHSVSMNLLIYGEDPAEPVMNTLQVLPVQDAVPVRGRKLPPIWYSAEVGNTDVH